MVPRFESGTKACPGLLLANDAGADAGAVAGTYTATDIAEWIYKGQSGGDRLGITVASGDFLSNGRDDFFMGSQFASGTGGGDGWESHWASEGRSDFFQPSVRAIWLCFFSRD